MSKKKGQQGKQKILAHFEKVTIKTAFQTDITALRETCLIPEEGFENDADYKEWVNKKRETVKSKLAEGVDALRKTYDLSLSVLDHLFLHYLFFNEIGDAGKDFSLVHVRDIKADKRGRDEFKIQAALSEEEDEFFPIAIMLSPYATRNDLKDFLDENFTKTIKPLQEKYRNEDTELGKTRGGTCQKRDAFIFAHRDLTHKEIRDKVRDELGLYVPVDNISKIISNQEKAQR